MNRALILITIELKRVIKALPQILIGAAVLIPVISAVAFCSNRLIKNNTGDTTITNSIHANIGLVSEDKSLMLQFGINMIVGSGEDSFLNVVTINDKETATSKLKNGEIIAAIIIPKDFINSVLEGTNKPLTIVFPDNPGLEAMAISEVCRVLTSVMVSYQSSIYSSYDFLIEYTDGKTANDANLRLNSIYISNFLNRNKLFKVNIVDNNAVSFTTYYICAAITLIYMTFGITFAGFFTSHSTITEKMLKKAGYTTTIQFLSKAISVTFIYLLLSSLFAGITGYLSSPRVWLAIIISSVIAGLYTVFMYKLFKTQTLLAMFVISVVLCIVSGCFIPQMLLSDTINRIGSITPSGIIFNLFINAI